MALESITGMPNLPITSAARAAFPAAPKGYMGPKEIAPIEEEIGGEIAKASQRVGEAEVNIEKAKREEKAKELETKATGLQKFAEETEAMPEKQALKDLREKQRGLEFIPTKDTAQDIAGLFSLIGVIGMVVGKGNAQQAMGAMNGMLEGHRKGRQDLFKQELQQFDKNFKAMQTKVSSALAEYQEALERKKVDKEAGELLAQAALAKAESPLLKAIKDKQGDVAVLERLKEAKKAMTETMPKMLNDLQKAKDDRAAADLRARLAREAADARAKANREAADARAKLTSQTKGVKKSSAKVDEGYIADNILKADIDDLTNDLKTNPSLVEKLKKYRVEAFLTEEGKILNQVVNEDIPPDLRQFLTKVRDIRNNYYLNISGKAVTGGEALRNYGTVPQPGDSPEEMVDKLQGMSNRVGQSISIKQQYFGLPELKISAGARTGLNPNENYGISSQSRFEVGQTYTDASGNKATYRGVDAEGKDVWQDEE